MIRVLLVEDHAVLRGALAFMLGREADLTVVAEAGSLAEARTVLAGASVDVALVDLNLPDGSGLEILVEIRHRNPRAAAVMLTGSVRPESQALAVAAGAAGFLHKSTDMATIATAIRRAAAGEPLLSPAETVTLLHQAAQYQTMTGAARRALDQLTPRELDILRELAAGHDNQTISDRLSLSTTTVRTHVTQVLRKLGVTSRLQAALLAVRHGVVDLDFN